MSKIILDLCGGTGAWSKPYLDAHYYIISVDIVNERNHDVRLYQKPEGIIHGILAAPPCTVFASSGARWPRTNEQMIEGLSVVDACLRLIIVCQPKWWCLENPIGKLSRFLGKPRMYFQPWEYGDPYTKRTALWGDFNEPKKNPVEPTEGGRIHRMAPSPDRTKLRSITPPGFAKAFFEANR